MHETAAKRLRDAGERVAPVVARLARLVRNYALVALVAAAFLAAVLLWPPLPDSAARLVLLALLVALVAAPPIVLLLLAWTLREVSELPGRVRELPATARERLEDAARLAGEARAQGRRLPLVLWQLGRVVSSSRELLQPHAPLLALFSVPFLAVSALAAVAAALEIAVAAVAAVVLAAT